MTYNNNFDYNNSSNPNNEYRQEQQNPHDARGTTALDDTFTYMAHVLRARDTSVQQAVRAWERDVTATGSAQ